MGRLELEVQVAKASGVKCLRRVEELDTPLVTSPIVSLCDQVLLVCFPRMLGAAIRNKREWLE